MAESIVQTLKECFVCSGTLNLERHHIFYGTSNRAQSEKYGCVCWLCHEHHTGPQGVHFNKALDESLKKYAQIRFYKTYGDTVPFVGTFGKSYL